MSRTIDERVVEMQFDNRQFERNVQTSMSTIDRLKQSLNFKGISKGFDDINSAARGVNLSSIGYAAETIGLKFNAMYTIADQALRNITNSAMAAGKRIVSALTIDPIKTGLSEYETQIGAVQTILANTESKGTTLQDVNAALDQLNTYADKTIYNFTEMTRNIGTFTAAGVDLETSVSSIQGIANLAAVSGSTSQQASTAMYQLSQALAAGKVQLMDWNSVVNAGMGGQVFQDALKRTAKNMGTNVDAMIKKYGSFRESLTKGEWLTAEVLTETLTQLSGAYTEADLIAKGYTKEQAAEITKLAETAVNAATKVKTATQLWDTLKEAAQSGWTQTWEIIIGDFEEAKELWSTISDNVGDLINKMSEARNKLLAGGLSSGWKQLLGAGISDEAGFQESIRGVLGDDKKFKWKALSVTFDELIEKTGSFEKAVALALKNGDMSSEDLTKSVSTLADKMRNMSAEERKAAGYTAEHVKQIEALEKGLKDGSISMDEFVKKMIRPSGRENLIESLFNTAKAFMSIVKPIGEAFRDIFPAMEAEQLYQFTVRLREFTEKLTLSEDRADKLKRAFKGLFSIFDMGRKAILAIAKPLAELAGSDGISSVADLIFDMAAGLGDFFINLNKNFDPSDISGSLSKMAATISDTLGIASDKLRDFGSVLKTVGEWIAKGLGWIWDGFKEVFGWVADNVSAGDIFAGLVGGGLFAALKKLAGLFDTVTESFEGLFGFFGKEDGEDLKSKFGDILDGVSDSLSSFTSGIQVASLIGVAAAVAILSSALKTISELDGVDIAKSLTAIGIALGIMMKALNAMPKNNIFTSKKFSMSESTNLIKSGISLMFMAKAIGILSESIVELSKLSLKDIAKGLIAVGGGIAELSWGLKAIGSTKVPLSTSIAMLALAESCNILGDAMAKFGSLSWDEIKHGLVGMGGALGELVMALGGLSKVGGGGALLGSGGIFITVQSLGELADSLKKFGEMEWDEIKRGLAGMGGALAELGLTLGIMNKLSASSFGIFSSKSKTSKLTASLSSVFSTKGKKSLGGALKTGGSAFSSIFSAGGIFIVVQSLSKLADSLKKFGEMDWKEIGHGLTAMGGALAEIAGITGALGKFAGLSSLFGAGSILIVVQGLGELAEQFKKFADMSWDEIGKGLSAMGGALLEVGGITGALGGFTSFAGILGAGAIWIAIQGLEDLANALKKFGEMNWDEIGRGLSAMGGALAEIAVGGILGTLAIIGSHSISEMSAPLIDLAEALKKFGEMNWDEIGHGLTAMGAALSEIALGGLLNTLSIIGAQSISEMAAPLGTLADSLKKWKDVTVPEGLGWKLATLASGLMHFTFSGFGASALATAAPAIGTMADSVKKWKDVTVPEGLSDQIASLASGIESLTYGLVGAGTLTLAAPALGQLADSIKKWSSITIPEGLESGLKQIARGVEAFTLAFAGGWSIGAIVEPLGSLPESIKKWKDVTIPDGLEDGLKQLANGIGAFSFAFLGGWSISAIIQPLSDLADSVSKWKNVTIPDGLKDDLTALADGVSSFTWAFIAGYSIDTIAGPLKTLASAVQKWVNISIPSDIGDQLKSLASGVKSFIGISDISTTVSNMKGLASAGSKLSGINFSAIGTSLAGFVSSVNNLGSISSSMSNLGKNMVSSLVNSIKAGAPQIKVAVLSLALSAVSSLSVAIAGLKASISASGKAIITHLSSGITSGTATLMVTLSTILRNANTYVLAMSALFQTSGSTISSKLGNGILIGSALVQSAMSFTMQRATSVANGYYDNFYSIGQSLASGMAEGINANSWMVEAKARAMARAAAQAAEDELDINSPSKVFKKIAYSVPEGFADGVDKLSYLATDSTVAMAKASVSGVKDAISKVFDVLNMDLDTQPTITPVIDLSSIQNGAAEIDGLLANKTMNVSGISASIKNGRQNDLSAILAEMQRSNSDNSDIVGAIANLRGDFGMLINAINNMKLTLDGGAVVGGLINKIDTGLGQIASHKGRGN